ncbi:MAG: TonB-dependent receptor [Deltaproteobacteria bacterium]|jgi:vitamin B12 transporter|nr:TonB-dependent receptor [Deltaproteobacteria bacterium]
MVGRYLSIILGVLVMAMAMTIASPTALLAQEAEIDNILDVLVVTAFRGLERAREVSQPIEVISSEEIKGSTGKDLSDILGSHGIQIDYQNTRNYGNVTITMRGLTTSTHGSDLFSEILILLNGRRIGMDTISLVGMDNVDRIEVIRGPGAMQYGSAGMGGVINIITKRGKEVPEGKIEVGMGTDEYYKTNLFASGRADKLDVAFGMSFSKSGSYSDAENNLIENSGVGSQIGFYGNFGWNFDEYNRVGLNITGAHVNRGGTGSTGVLTTGPEDYRNHPYREAQWKKTDSADLLYEGQTQSGEFTWLGRYFYGESSYYTLRTFEGLPAGLPSDYLTTKSEFKNQGAQAQISWNQGIFHLTAGMDWLKLNMRQRQTLLPYVTADRRSDANSVFTNFGGFLLGRVNLLTDNNLVISGGIRYDSYDIDIDSLVRGAPREIEPKSYEKFIPSIGIAYSPIEELKLRVNYAKAYRVPTPRELIGNFFMGSTLYVGNPNLEPEENGTLDLGFDLQWGNFAATVSYFRSKVKNYIGTEVLPEGTGYINIPDVNINGFEVSWRFNIARQLGWDFDLSPYMYYTHLLDYETPDGKKLANLDQTTLAGGLDIYSEEYGLSAQIKATYHGMPEITSFRTQAKSSGRGGATVWDVSLTKVLYEFGDASDISLKLGIDNLTNKLYEVGAVSATAAPDYGSGRTFYLGLVYNMD